VSTDAPRGLDANVIFILDPELEIFVDFFDGIVRIFFYENYLAVIFERIRNPGWFEN
jgi:hypothetical protein